MTYKRKMSADLDPAQLEEISIGDTVEIVIRGNVCELRAPYEYDTMPCGCPMPDKSKKAAKKETSPASITVDVMDTKVRELLGKDSVPPGDEE